MSTSSIIWIIVAVVVVIAIVAALLWVARNRRDERRHIEAEQIREDVADKSLQVGEREARAEETAAKARMVQAEADAKAAEASALQHHAAQHRKEATSSREELNQQRDHADTIDPKVPNPEEPRSTPDQNPCFSLGTRRGGAAHTRHRSAVTVTETDRTVEHIPDRG